MTQPNTSTGELKGNREKSAIPMRRFPLTWTRPTRREQPGGSFSIFSYFCFYMFIHVRVGRASMGRGVGPCPKVTQNGKMKFPNVWKMGFPKYQHLVPVFSGRWEEGVAVDEVMPALSSWGQVPVYRRQHRADPFPVQRRLPVGPEGEMEGEG